MLADLNLVVFEELVAATAVTVTVTVAISTVVLIGGLGGVVVAFREFGGGVAAGHGCGCGGGVSLLFSDGDVCVSERERDLVVD